MSAATACSIVNELHFSISVTLNRNLHQSMSIAAKACSFFLQAQYQGCTIYITFKTGRSERFLGCPQSIHFLLQSYPFGGCSVEEILAVQLRKSWPTWCGLRARVVGRWPCFKFWFPQNYTPDNQKLLREGSACFRRLSVHFVPVKTASSVTLSCIAYPCFRARLYLSVALLHCTVRDCRH